MVGKVRQKQLASNYIDHASTDNDDALKAEKLRKLTADADMAEIVQDKERGKYLDAARLKKTWEGAVLNARGILLVYPANGSASRHRQKRASRRRAVAGGDLRRTKRAGRLQERANAGGARRGKRVTPL